MGAKMRFKRMLGSENLRANPTPSLLGITLGGSSLNRGGKRSGLVGCQSEQNEIRCYKRRRLGHIAQGTPNGSGRAIDRLFFPGEDASVRHCSHARRSWCNHLLHGSQRRSAACKSIFRYWLKLPLQPVRFRPMPQAFPPYEYRAHLISCSGDGGLPYINTPTRNIFAANQIMPSTQM